MGNWDNYNNTGKNTSKASRPTIPYKELKPDKTLIVSEGSAITYGVCPNAEYGSPQVRSYPGYFEAKNFSRPYSYVANCADSFRASQVDACVNSTTTAVFTFLPEDDIYSMDTGGNGYVTSYLSTLGNYLDNRKAAGFIVVLLTSLPRDDTHGGNVWLEWRRRDQNWIFLNTFSGHYHSVCDFNEIYEMQNISNTELYVPWHNAANSTYSPGVFPTQLGHQLIAAHLKQHLANNHHINF